MAGADTYAAQISKHGDETLLKVKKTKVRYVLPGDGNAWHVEGSGPGKWVLGIRIFSQTVLPERANLHAELDGASASDTALTVKPGRDVRLDRTQKKAKTKYSAEVSVEIELSAGNHTVVLSLSDVQGLARTLDKPSKDRIALARFTPIAALETPELTKIEASGKALASAPEPTEESGRAAAAPKSSTAANAAAASTEVAAPAVEEIMAHKTTGGGSADDELTAVVPTENETSTPVEFFPITVAIGFRTGFPQVISELGTAVGASLGVGFLLPVLSQRLEVYADVGLCQSSRETTAADPRLVSSQKFDLTLVEQELTVGLGGIYRIFTPETPLNFFGRLGVQMDLQRSNVEGAAASAAFGENSETDTAIGMVLGGGASYRLGPGALEAELSFAFAGLDHHVSGDSSTGGLGLGLGYRLMF
ncbi:MAG: hypothetical protein A2289_11320 [Deltaproteobacteria bacterium RIFOXYA12_FULL_58_15]|nr:MAG: hypothetical protein A2289_11320 [Deltaproteobacteria bacterium RIFOXYA12_FULL_58_15]OGR14550.1 MAG: hypothetical protein A2341_04805 [Deltaproteobacteria bacterium RIFOXYB12_FULL_58_9]